MIEVRLAHEDEAEQIQAIYNAQKNAPYLGGFTMLEPIKSKIENGSAAVVVRDGEVIAADETSRDGTHRLKLQLVAVKEDFKRQKCATMLYTFWSLTAALEGRFQMVDTIVGDNPLMPIFLPTLGFEKVSSQRSKVRRHHSLDIWYGSPFKSLGLSLGNEYGILQHHIQRGLELSFDLEMTPRRQEMLEASAQKLEACNRTQLANELFQLAGQVQEMLKEKV